MNAESNLTPVSRNEQFLNAILNDVHNMANVFSSYEGIVIVNYTSHKNEETDEYDVQCDKTAEEIYQAYTSGKVILGRMNNTINLNLVFCMEHENIHGVSWSTMFAAGRFSVIREDLSDHDIITLGVFHVDDDISIRTEVVMTNEVYCDGLAYLVGEESSYGQNS